MSELIFIRHGQASFGEASYDKLSEKGVEQVRILAQHWQETGERFDCIYSGNLLRQKETARELLCLVKDSPQQVTENASFNEYNAEPLMRIYLRDHGAREGLDPVDRKHWKDEKKFQQIIEAATMKWIRGELEPQAQDEGFESWADFQCRVHLAIDEIMARHSSNAKVLISTSGGVVATAMQRVLQFPDEQVIRTNWMVHNSSVTRVKYGQGKLSLTLFNNLAHLERPGLQHMITFR
ncbi:MAG: histidine phosphatase family protein [Pseudohongiella sp.]|nr:histidine phosphatase family protein [Pseudohongiella sp.]